MHLLGFLFDPLLGLIGHEMPLKRNDSLIYKKINQYILTSIKLLNHAISNFRLKLVEGIQPNPKTIKANLENSLMLVTALVPKIGYEKAAEIANLAFNESINLKEATIKLGYLTANDFEDAINTNKMI